MKTIDVKLIQAKFVLGMLSPEELVRAAIEAIVAGSNDENLIVLAGLSKNEINDANAIFLKFVHSVGLENMSKDTALRVYVQSVSCEIAYGKRDPYEGAQTIWNAIILSDTGLHDFDVFIYAASEYDSRPEDRAFFRAKILEEANAICGS